MADTLVDLIQAVQSSASRGAVQKPTSQLSTDPDNPGGNLFAQASDPLRTVPFENGATSTWFPEIPAEVLGSFSNALPERPGGATEVLSVTQTRGAKDGANFPIALRSYPVRGTVV